MARTVGSVAELVGNTPLIRLRHMARDLPKNVEVYVKAEWLNPGGSVKDRAALNIVHTAIKDGSLMPGGTLLDASSGNTGIAYAMLGAAMGFKLTLCLPANANHERKRTLKAYGAELILTDPNDGSDGAIKKAREMAAEFPDEYFYADQYNNDANWQAHYTTTGPEIAQQTNQRITHFVAALGTTGTCMGVGKYLREHLPKAKVIGFQPDSPFHGLEGLKHLETAIVPGIYDAGVHHEKRECKTERAHETARRLAREDGLLLGVSASAAVYMALQVAQEEAEAEAGREAVVVTVGCDGGERYLSDHFWDET